MSKDKSTAEKDLLKIIEGAKTPASEPSPLAGKGAGSPLAHLSALAARRADLKAMLLDHRNVNKFLIGVAVVIVGYFVTGVFTESSKIKQAPLKVQAQETARDVITPPTELEESAQTPGEAAASLESGDPTLPVRNVFKPGYVSQQRTPMEEVVSPAAKFRLVGVSVEADPADTYAMIENTETKITFFLKLNETLEGMVVKEITEDKVNLDYQGETHELR